MSNAFRFLLSFDWNSLNEEAAQDFINDLSRTKFTWILPPHRVLGEPRGIGVLETDRQSIDNFVGSHSGFNAAITPVIESKNYNTMISRARSWGEEESHIKFLIELNRAK